MTKLQILNVFLTERLMLAAQEIYKAVEDTILEYQEEIIRGKRENDQLRYKLREAGIETWPERPLYDCEEEGDGSTGQKVDPEVVQHVEKESCARKGGRPTLRDQKSHSTSSPQGNADYVLQPASQPILSPSPEESGEGDSPSSSAYKQVKTEAEGLGSTAAPDNPMALSSLNLDCASAQSENSVSMMGLEGDVGILSELEALQVPAHAHADHSLQMQDPALRCTVCGKACRHLGHLNAHARTHTRDKPFLCGLCGKSFSSSGRLKGHQRIHTGEKPYQCHYCRKRFNQTAHLKVHLRVHTGEKPFSCPVCGKSFSQSNKVKRHLVTHSRDRQFLPGQ